jgi:hypothetical protein
MVAPKLLVCLLLLLSLVMGLNASTAVAVEPAPIQFTRFSSADGFASGGLDGTQLEHELLTLAPGELQGTWTTPVVQPGFGFTRLVPSWNADTPGDSSIRVDVQATTEGGAGTEWYRFGTWASSDHAVQRTSVRGQSDSLGRIDTDTLVSRREPFVNYTLRVTLERANAEDPSPTLRMLGAQVSNTEFSPAQATSSPLVVEGVELPVPSFSQEIHANEYPQWGGGGEVWCSPTSTQMVIEYWGRRPTAEQLAWVDPRYADPSVDFAARGTYDSGYRGTGNWTFNAAYAASYGLDAFVTQLRSLAEAEQFIRAGIPLVASIASGPRELRGFLFDGGTNGHLVVIVGFDASGHPIVNDPAAWSNASVRRVYDRAQFERVWQRGSGGTVYVIRPPDVPLPATPVSATPNW